MLIEVYFLLQEKCLEASGTRMCIMSLVNWKWKSLSRIPLFATLWTIVSQAPLSMGLSRQEYWSGLPCPSPGNLPNPGVEPKSSALQADFLPPEPPGKPFYVLEEPTIIFLSNSFWKVER